MFVGAVDYGTILKLLRGAAVQMQGLSVEALCIKLIKIFMLTMFRKNSIFHFPSIFFTRIFKSEISFNLFFIEIKKHVFKVNESSICFSMLNSFMENTLAQWPPKACYTF